MLILDYTTSDEINDSVVKSERGELVRPTLDVQFSHYRRDVWRAPARLLFKIRLASGVQKTEINTRFPPNGQETDLF